jgi:hypothetical protein
VKSPSHEVTILGSKYSMFWPTWFHLVLRGLDISTASDPPRLAPELLRPGGMLKRLGLRILELIDNVPLGWLVPSRQPVPVRRPRHPFAR